jgi:hypothetical protein
MMLRKATGDLKCEYDKVKKGGREESTSSLAYNYEN